MNAISTRWTTVTEDALPVAISCCKGNYQRELVFGLQAWSGSTLAGKAASYGSHYKESREGLLRRLAAAGLRVRFQRIGWGHRLVARIALEAKIMPAAVPAGPAEGRVTVISYDSGKTLEGEPSEKLVRESIDARPTGAVPAYLDVDGVWQYVQPREVEHYRTHLREKVVTVYVP